MKILLLHRQQSAVAYYRTQLPARALRLAGHDVTVFQESFGKALKPNPVEWMVKHQGEFDLLVVDRAWKGEDAALFAGLRHYSPNCRMIVDFDDDFTNVPWWNTAHSVYQPGQQYREAGKMHLKLSELTTVSTQHLVDTFKPLTHQIRLAPNHIDPADWEGHQVNPDRKLDDAVYVLYGGAGGHFGDLDDVRLGLESVLRNPPVNLRLVCFGSLPAWLHQIARDYPGRVITLPWVPFSDWAEVLAWGGFSLALAPLAQHPFNLAKSNIKYLEHSLLGFPTLCSDVGPYHDIPDECCVKVDNTPAQWSEALRALLTDPSLRSRLVQKAQQHVKTDFTLEKLAEKWHIIVEEAATLPRIVDLEGTRLPAERASEPALVPEQAPTEPQTAGS